MCVDGFRGRHCEYTTHTCECEHGGTCRSLYDGQSYECLCDDGYTGDNCEVQINECHSNPCVHGNYIMDFTQVLSES